jgi:hypothetical protein
MRISGLRTILELTGFMSHVFQSLISLSSDASVSKTAFDSIFTEAVLLSQPIVTDASQFGCELDSGRN